MFARTDRLPAWIAAPREPTSIPWKSVRDPPELAALRQRVESDIAQRRRYSVFDTSIGGVKYQVVALLAYEGMARERLDRVFGVAVNLEWARAHYFNDILQQVAQIAGNTSATAFAVIDERGRRVAGTLEPVRAGGDRDAQLSRSFLRPHADCGRSTGRSHAAILDRRHERGRRPDLRAGRARRPAQPCGRRLGCHASRAQPPRHRTRGKRKCRRRGGTRRFRRDGHSRAENAAFNDTGGRRDVGARAHQDRPGPQPLRAYARARRAASDPAGEQPARVFARHRRDRGVFVRIPRACSTDCRSDARIPPAADRRRRSARRRCARPTSRQFAPTGRRSCSRSTT